jgi:hypothetical protein
MRRIVAQLVVKYQVLIVPKGEEFKQNQLFLINNLHRGVAPNHLKMLHRWAPRITYERKMRRDITITRLKA